MASQRGIFIVLDGPEGSGKSTQSKLLSSEIGRRGRNILHVRDPGSTRIGEKIRGILLDPEYDEMAMRCEMMLYMAARAQMVSELIAPALRGGAIVLSDRYVSSTLAYQLGEQEITAAEIRSAAAAATGGTWPDLTIILDIDPAAAFERMQGPRDRIEQRSLEYHRQVRANYLQQARDDASYTVIDAARAIELVQQDVWNVVSAVIGMNGP